MLVQWVMVTCPQVTLRASAVICTPVTLDASAVGDMSPGDIAC